MNWGYKILTAIMVFLTGMGTMVTIAMRQNNDLVDDQYYVRELTHQQLLDADKNLNALNGKITIQKQEDAIVILLPEAASQAASEASITFIRPNDKKKDRHYHRKETPQQIRLSSKDFSTGWYTVRVSWTNEQIPYYNEQSFYCN